MPLPSVADRVRTLAQPPLVWGPSEINAWIEGSYPSKGKKGGRAASRAPTVASLAVKVWTDSTEAVRGVVVEALEALGYRREATASTRLELRKGNRSVVARFRASLLKDAVSVALRFDPPTTRSVPRRIVRTLEGAFPLEKVSLRPG